LGIPEQFRDYPCSEYFVDGWSERGHFDEESQTLVIAPLAEAYEDLDIAFFAVGRSGCGGIDFGYRRGQAGLWAYYPIDQEFVPIAPTIAELVMQWHSGKVVL
jgi:hypothetical protein